MVRGLERVAAVASGCDAAGGALEILTRIRRAGAYLILTYHAREAADWLASRLYPRARFHDVPPPHRSEPGRWPA